MTVCFLLYVNILVFKKFEVMDSGGSCNDYVKIFLFVKLQMSYMIIYHFDQSFAHYKQAIYVDQLIV